MTYSSSLYRQRPNIPRVTRIILVPTVLLLCMAAVSKPPAALQPGDTALPFSLEDSSGKVHTCTPDKDGPILVLSLKPHDRYSTAAVESLNRMFLKFPQLNEGLNRWVVISRTEERESSNFEIPPHLKNWVVLFDSEDTVYRDYKIIATPTVTIAGGDGIVTGVHPGYDPGMIHDVRMELAKLLNVSLPASVEEAPERPNLTLQLGRRMASRGLWERALTYYQKASETEPLSQKAQLELVTIYLELGELDEAGTLLKSLDASQVDEDELKAVRERLEMLTESQPLSTEPPKIFR